MEDAADAIPLYELDYAHLLLLSCSSSPSQKSPQEIQRLESITRNVMLNLGPSGPGLLSITGVPKASRLRQSLLPLARKISLLNTDDRKRLLKEHNLGSDVPLKNLDRIVSSFAMQLKHEKGFASPMGVNDHDSGRNSGEEGRLTDVCDGEFKELGFSFKELGFVMMEIGVRLARLCDRVIGGHELEESLLESCAAKGRLIHYHSRVDNSFIKESTRKYSCKSRISSGLRDGKHLNASEQCDDLWQQWHYDYGIFTVLTAPLFMLGNCLELESSGRNYSSFPLAQQCPSPSGHTYLQIFHPGKNCALMVKASSESFIVQVGEAADVLSKGKLRATLHCVCRPARPDNLSRETFVVFLQPAWNKTFSLSDYPIAHLTSDSPCSELCINNFPNTQQRAVKFPHNINNIIPPLPSRLKDGMTFAEFSKETTRQYYGGNGLQSKR